MYFRHWCIEWQKILEIRKLSAGCCRVLTCSKEVEVKLLAMGEERRNVTCSKRAFKYLHPGSWFECVEWGLWAIGDNSKMSRLSYSERMLILFMESVGEDTTRKVGINVVTKTYCYYHQLHQMSLTYYFQKVIVKKQGKYLVNCMQ